MPNGSHKIRSAVSLAKTALHAHALKLVSKEASQRYLINSLADIPGLPAKAAQLFAMRLGDAALSSAPSQPPLALDSVRAEIDAKLPSLANEVVEISPDGVAASIGQVHWSRLRDGREVAIKVQLPEVREALAAQIDLLFGASRLSPVGNKGLDLNAYKEFFSEKIREETDYIQEANAQQRFATTYSTIPGLKIPQPIMEHVCQEILVQEWVPAVALDREAAHFSIESRLRAADALTRFVLQSALVDGLIHTDLQPRNLGMCQDAERPLVIYDFGSHCTIEPRSRQILVELIDKQITGSRHSPFDYLVALGFDATKLGHIADRIAAVTAVMFEPFSEFRPWRPDDWQFGLRTQRILGEDNWWFRSAGPPWFLLLMRSFHGALTALQNLNVGVRIGRIYEAVRDQVANQPGALNVPDMSAYAKTPLRLSTDCAKTLTICVSENLRQVVRLSMPPRAVDDIETVIPPETLAKIESSGIELSSIKAAAQQSGYARQILFETAYENRQIKVALE